MNQTLELADWGWRPFFQSQLKLEEIAMATPARVLAVHRGGIDVGGPMHAGRIADSPRDA